MTAASTRGAITGAPLRSFSSAPQPERGHDRRLGRVGPGRDADRRIGARLHDDRAQIANAAADADLEPRGAAEPRRLRHPGRVALALVGVRKVGAVDRLPGAEAALQVCAADLEARVARAAPVQAGEREPAPHANRLQDRPVRRGRRIGHPARRRGGLQRHLDDANGAGRVCRGGRHECDEHGRRQGGQGVGAKRRHRRRCGPREVEPRPHPRRSETPTPPIRDVYCRYFYALEPSDRIGARRGDRDCRPRRPGLRCGTGRARGGAGSCHRSRHGAVRDRPDRRRREARRRGRRDPHRHARRARLVDARDHQVRAGATKSRCSPSSRPTAPARRPPACS